MSLNPCCDLYRLVYGRVKQCILIRDVFVRSGMGKLKKALLAIVGTVVGIVALREVRKRRSRNTEEELEG